VCSALVQELTEPAAEKWLEEKDLSTPRATWVSLALTLLLAGWLAGCSSSLRGPERITEPDSARAAEEEQVASRSSEPTVSIPPRDAAGSEISGLPRYPGSVRVEYERGRRGGLEMVHARYLTRDGLDAVRGYYRGVFRAEGWMVANAEFYEDEWTFLVLHGEREADIEIEAHEGGVTGMDIELIEPLPEEIASQDKPSEPKPKKEPPQPKPNPPRQPRYTPPPETPAPTLQSASPAPQSASPAPQPAASATPQPASPAPGYYGDDDFGDDDWGGDDDGDGDD
jgi:hypothetical protein